MKKVVLLFSIVSFALFSCENNAINTPGPTQATGSKYAREQEKMDVVNYFPPKDPVDDPGTCSGCGGSGITYTPPQSPTLFNAAPFIPSGQASSSFSSTGEPWTDMVAFGPAEAEYAFPFTVASGTAKVWMGFAFKNGPYLMVVRGYPIGVNNGVPTWFPGALPTQLVGGTSSNSINFHWVVTTYGSDGNIATPGHYEVSGAGSYAVADVDVTISQLSINAQDRLTLKATVKLGSSIYQIDKTNYIRIH